MKPGPTGSFVLALALALALAGCAGEPPPAGVQGSTTPVEVTAAGGWMLPVEGAAWSRSRMLAVLLRPLDEDRNSLQVLLNGQERTRDFLPSGLINRRLRQRADALRQGSTNEGRADPAARPETDMMRRLQAVFDHHELRPGVNTLEALFTGADGHPGRHVVRFTYQPGGRLIRCTVMRRSRHGEDTAAAARLVVTPLQGAPAVDLSPGTSHPLYPWPAWRQRPFVVARNGEATFFLPEGRYRITATGGLLDGIASWEVPARGDARHHFVIQRQVEIPGTATVDFHVHAAPSPDSILPLTEQVAAFQAAGVDVLVATDHNIVTDYRPLIARLPWARGRIRSLPGTEASLRAATGGSLGHMNVWPLVPDDEAPPVRPGQVTSFGALALPPLPSAEQLQESTAVAEAFEAYRARGLSLAAAGSDAEIPAGLTPVLQLNHPRGTLPNDPSAPLARRNNIFSQAGWQGGQALPPMFSRATSAGTRALDFEALELWNRSSRRLYREVRDDWFTFLNHGLRRTATANSDSHTIAPELAGFPLNIVFLEEGQPDGPDVPVAALVDAVRQGRLVGTDGPVPLLRVVAGQQAASPGDTLPAADGRIRVEVEVLAADWVPVRGIRVWVNGRVAATSTERTLQASLQVAEASWVVAEVGEAADLPETGALPGIYGQLVPRGLALGYTNPVWVTTGDRHAGQGSR